MAPVDIFRFWSQIKPHQKIHPADRDVFRRVGQRGHGLKLNCLPGNFMGPLKTASIVLLFLSPGFVRFDAKFARTSKGRSWYAKTRTGNHPLPSKADHASANKWWEKFARMFEVEPIQLRDKMAILDIGAYHSKKFSDYPLLAALQSSRVTLEWAQTVLFPQAMRGERIVICLRSPHFWGLARGRKRGRSLFSPNTTRGGYPLLKRRRDKKLRDEIIRSVQIAIRNAQSRRSSKTTI